MKTGYLVDLILNQKVTHEEALKKSLRKAEKLDCVVAFAKCSGLEPILKHLQSALKKGLEARFAVGLSFYQTDPWVLEVLLEESKKNNLKVWISNTDPQVTFHPKIYATTSSSGGSVLIGSANLTGGGLGGNVEASARIDDPNGELFTKVARYINRLIKKKSLVVLDEDGLAKYKDAHFFHEQYRKLLQRRAEQAARERVTNERPATLILLSDFLALMRDDKSEHGHASQWASRIKSAAAAKKMIRAIGNAHPLTADQFKHEFEELLSRFHSSGISRSKTALVKGRRGLQRSYKVIYEKIDGDPSATTEEAYETLHKEFLGINRAGVNQLTEILHALNPKRFPVMNKNAVSGLALAGFEDFPSAPSKANVDGALYAKFCEAADIVRTGLGLADFASLDALFNFVYWKPKIDRTKSGQKNGNVRAP